MDGSTVRSGATQLVGFGNGVVFPHDSVLDIERDLCYDVDKFSLSFCAECPRCRSIGCEEFGNGRMCQKYWIEYRLPFEYAESQSDNGLPLPYNLKLINAVKYLCDRIDPYAWIEFMNRIYSCGHCRDHQHENENVHFHGYHFVYEVGRIIKKLRVMEFGDYEVPIRVLMEQAFEHDCQTSEIIAFRHGLLGLPEPYCAGTKHWGDESVFHYSEPCHSCTCLSCFDGEWIINFYSTCLDKEKERVILKVLEKREYAYCAFVRELKSRPVLGKQEQKIVDNHRKWLQREAKRLEADELLALSALAIDNNGCEWASELKRPNDKFQNLPFKGVKFLREPVVDIDRLDKLKKLFPLFCTGSFDLEAFGEAFYNFNSLLYETQWFAKGDYPKAIVFLKDCYELGKELQNLKSNHRTHKYRKTETVPYFIKHYKYLLHTFCGIRKNQFTDRIDQYISYKSLLAPKQNSVKLTVKERIDRGSRGGGLYLKSKNPKKDTDNQQIESQMMGGSFVAAGLKSVANNFAPEINDCISTVLANYVASIPEKVSSFASSALEAGAGLFRKLGSFLYSIFESVRDSLKAIIDGFDFEMAEVPKSLILFLFSIVVLLLILYFVRESLSQFKRCISAAVVFIMNKCGYDCDSSLVLELERKMESHSNNTLESHSMGDVISVLGLALGIALSVTNKNHSQAAGAAINMASRLPLVYNNLEEGLSNVFDKIYFKVYEEHFFKDRQQMTEFEKYLGEFDEFSQIPEVEVAMKSDLEVATKLKDLYRKGLRLKSALVGMKVNPSLANAMVKAVARINELQELAEKISDLYLTRIETPCLWMYGKSGQGKTTVTEHIVAALYMRLKAADPKQFYHDWSRDHMHHRVKNSDYWEGYHQNFAVVWNEAFEKKDPLERAKVASEILTACEDGIYPLNMAFDQKGKAFFNSMLAVVSSNLSDEQLIGSSGLTHPSAVVRRRTLHLEVIRTGTFSEAKCNFDESWAFRLHCKFTPGSPEFEAFNLATPKEYAELACEHGYVDLVFSEVVNGLFETISQRIAVRQDKTEFMRTFDYVNYCKVQQTKKENRVRNVGKGFDPLTAMDQASVLERRMNELRNPSPAVAFNKRAAQNRKEKRQKIIGKKDEDVQRRKEHRPLVDTPVLTSEQWEDTFDVVLPDSDFPVPPVVESFEDVESPLMALDPYSGFNQFEWAAALEEFAAGEIDTVYDKEGRAQQTRAEPTTTTTIESHMLGGIGRGFTTKGDTYLGRFSKWISRETNEKEKEEALGFMTYESQFAPVSNPNLEVELRSHAETITAIESDSVPIRLLGKDNVFMQEVGQYLWKKFVAPVDPDCRRRLRHVLMYNLILIATPEEHRTPIFKKVLKSIAPYGNAEYLLFFSGCSAQEMNRILVEAKVESRNTPLDWFYHVIAHAHDEEYEIPDEAPPEIMKYMRLVHRCHRLRLAWTRAPQNYKDMKLMMGVDSQTFEPKPKLSLRSHFLVLKDNAYRWMDEKSVPFLRKYGLIVFGALASVVCISLSILNKKELEPEKEVVYQGSIFDQEPPVEGISHGPSSVRQSLRDQGLIPDTRGPKHLPRYRNADPQFGSHSLPRDIRAKLPQRPNFQPHSLPREQRARLPGRPQYTPHSETCIQCPECESFRPTHLLREVEGIVHCDQCGFILSWNDEARDTVAPHESEWVDDPSYIQSHIDDESRQVCEISSYMKTLRFWYGDQYFDTDGILSGYRFITVGHPFSVYGPGFTAVEVINNGVPMATFFGKQVKVTNVQDRRDIVYVDLDPRSTSAFKSLKSKLFRSQSELEKWMHPHTEYSRVSKQFLGDQVVIERIRRTGASRGETVMTSNQYGKGTLDMANYYILAGGMGKPGDCGQPYTLAASNGHIYVAGIHVGKVGYNSYFCPVTLDDFVEPQVGKIESHCAYIPRFIRYITPEISKNVRNGKYAYLGQLYRKKIMPAKTNLRESPAQGDGDRPPMYPITSAPACLTVTEFDDGTVVEPLKKALAKLGASPARPLRSWMKDLIIHRKDIAFRGFFPKEMNLKKIRFWTIEEAIFGIPGLWDGLPSDTAIGYDMECLTKATKRSDLWNKETQWIHPVLRALVQDLFDAVKRGEKPKNVVAGCLKDETRDLERVHQGKTRLFCIGSLSHLVFTVMVMGSLVMEMKDKRSTSDVAIGTDIHGHDWKNIYNKLFELKGDKKFGGGDFGNYDTSLNSWIGWALGEACVPYFNVKSGSYEEDLIRAVCESALAPLLVISDQLYWFDYFNSSGGWLTGFINSFANVLIFNTALFYCQFKNKDECQEFFDARPEEFFRLWVYGDDNIWSILEKYSKYFNMQFLEQYIYEFFGMEYTTPAKTKIDCPFVEIEDLEFLCRKFVPQGTMLRAPLNVDSIYSMLMWIRQPKPTFQTAKDGTRYEVPAISLDDQFLINVEVACQEWFHYGRERFQLETDHMRDYCKWLGLPFPGKSYEHYADRWLHAQH